LLNNIADLTTRQQLPDAVSALVAAMSIFERDTSMHLVATSVLAARIAARLDLEPIQIENCRIAAMLHDVGMLGINSTILTHPSMLSDPEWEILTEHSVLGAELLSVIPSLAHLAPIVRAHHERIDGSGYPDALIGEEIPIEARIIAVADAFHTMTIPTPYRSADATTSAMAELIGNAGTQFDERVVDAFGTSVNYRRRLRRASG
jgi:HD-GYP domain-containing protein (c-di-GMP phosphodiesterase class II)